MGAPPSINRKKAAQFSQGMNSLGAADRLKKILGMDGDEQEMLERQKNMTIPNVEQDVNDYQRARQQLIAPQKPVEQKPQWTEKQLDEMYNEFQPKENTEDAQLAAKKAMLMKLRGF